MERSEETRAASWVDANLSLGALRSNKHLPIFYSIQTLKLALSLSKCYAFNQMVNIVTD